MKKLSLVLVVLFFISMITYGSEWSENQGGDLYVNPTSTDVGIGTSSPSNSLDIGSGTFEWDGGGGELRSSYNTIYWERENFRIAIDADNDQDNAKFIISNNGFSDDKIRLHLEGGDSYINTGGNLGIGVTNPDEKLEVNGNLKIGGNNRKIIADYGLTFEGYTGSYEPATLKLDQASNAYLYGGNGGGTIKHNVILAHTGSQAWGNVGIGTASPTGKLEVYDGQLVINEPNGNPEVRFLENGTLQYTFQYKPANDYFTISEYGVSDHFVIKDGGNVGIGTTNPQSKLTVNGIITAEEIEVQVDIQPDFVFENNYKLMPLNELEKVIKKEKSLPGIPTSEEAVKEGVKLGDMQSKLLQKVEELTLYVIEQDKKLTELKKEVGSLRKENRELRQEISSLSN